MVTDVPSQARGAEEFEELRRFEQWRDNLLADEPDRDAQDLTEEAYAAALVREAEASVEAAVDSGVWGVWHR